MVSTHVWTDLLRGGLGGSIEMVVTALRLIIVGVPWVVGLAATHGKKSLF